MDNSYVIHHAHLVNWNNIIEGLFRTVGFIFKYTGGGWTLVVSISSNNNDHLQRDDNNCLNSVLCVRFTHNNITAGKLSDQDIYKLAQTEGKVTKLTN